MDDYASMSLTQRQLIHAGDGLPEGLLNRLNGVCSSFLLHALASSPSSLTI